MSDTEELDFELVTNARQLASPPPLRHEPVTLTEWKTTSGKAARFLVWELDANDYASFFESGWVYNKDGSRKRYDDEFQDIRFLAHVLRDQHGNRLWPKTEDAKAVLGRLGKSSINDLAAVATRLNSARDGAKEGNSEGTRNDS